ncbi:glycosyl hydrolase [Granulicella sp. dw_53]|uniref:glycosyl hydrolase n=1 Tax=Granulicella sp. dw_53 TaxID=2719792 RepID=UPI001BD401A8|nr:glycosyl hydrolase [Granulicella sp. dw_53]
MPTFSARLPQALHLARASATLAVLLAAPQSSSLFAADRPINLKQQFQNPPADARPMMRWWWFGTAVEKPEILRELQQMKADGIGGVELAFVYPQILDEPSKNLVNQIFVGPEMLDNVRYAQSEGRKLGLRIDVTLGSGWPYGGAATTLEEAAGHLRVSEIPLPANATTLPKFKLPEGDSIISAAVVSGEPKSWDATSAKTVETIGNAPLPPGSGPRTALFFISSHTKQQVKRAAVGSEGWVLDPFSHQAVATHLKTVGEPLVKAFGATPPYAVFSDSLEAYGADWTPPLPAEFKRRRGYDLLPHLPELVAGGTPSAEAVRHDWGKTLTELVDENYLTQINNWAIAHHTKFRSQTYGEPAVNFSSQKLVALPEGEGPQWRAFSTLRWATSANHVFGNNVTSGETFTWLHSPVFRATPLDMKAEADIDFIMGENQIIGHGWPYSAPQVGEPGWSLYAAAVFNDHNPWHPVMPDVARYIQRMSFLLRQGQPANQVAILVPTDDAWAHFTPSKVTVTGELARLITPRLMSTILSAGYNVDFIDAEAIDRLGIHHPILLIPPTDRIPVTTLRKIQAWVTTGGKVISIGHAPSLSAEGKATPEIATLAKQLFDPSKQTFVPDESTLAEALNRAQSPDFKFETTDRDTIGFIRRKLPTADIYFVVNTSNRLFATHASFATKYKAGEQWDPDSTASIPVPSADARIFLAPYESRVFVFSNTGQKLDPKSVEHDKILDSAAYFTGPIGHVSAGRQLADLSENWQLRFTGTNKSEPQSKLTDWIADPATKNYSGEVVYTRDFTLSSTPTTQTFLQVEGGAPVAGGPTAPPEHAPLGPNGLPDPKVTRPGPGMRAWYDPPIREAAIVLINGQKAGSLWHPPYRLDVSKFLKTGQNHIEIRVYNTAINAWAALPPHDYKPLIAKYGDRFQMQDLDKVQPVSSGLLGPIHLVTVEATH